MQYEGMVSLQDWYMLYRLCELVNFKTLGRLLMFEIVQLFLSVCYCIKTSVFWGPGAGPDGAMAST